MTDEIPEVRHPLRGDGLTPLERQLWRLRMVAVEVQAMLRGYNSVDDVAKRIPDALLFPLTNYGLVLVAKFLEVWDDFGSLAKSETKVVAARRAVGPLTKRIDVWKGFDDFRNTALVHAYLTKSGKLVGPWYLLAKHRVPTYHAEVILLLHCVNFAVAGVLAAFQSEYKALGPALRSNFPEPDSGPGISLGTDISPALKAILPEVDKRLQNIGVPASNPVFAEFRAATQGETSPSE